MRQQTEIRVIVCYSRFSKPRLAIVIWIISILRFHKEGCYYLGPRFTKSINYQDTDSDCHLLSELIWSPSSNDFCPPCFEIPSRSLVCQDGMTYAWTQWLAYEKLLHIWPLMFIHFLIYVCTRTTDTQWRHKSKKSEILGRCGRQNMLRPYLKNLGLGFDFRPCSEGNFLTGRP